MGSSGTALDRPATTACAPPKQQAATHEPTATAAEGVHDGTYRVQTPDHSREAGS